MTPQRERENTLIPTLLEQEVARAERTREWEDIQSACTLIDAAHGRGIARATLAPFSERIRPLFDAAMEAGRLNLIQRIKDRARESGAPLPSILGRLEARCSASA